ncbi:hypothetical protein RFI_03411 [Reticulomyxa filosa]|uniref:Uncharacterized protein n=1 Tax=Reticulomyxa filosa TaxID=46433 RepID=X6P7T1_RETFI|nr:hypothetical protein RFI_03411 [Reticulomyxa filosa]|eukprot:ETO33692.1 hypothetical protein RFI_03411 [Reticulomyxa filosa]
MIEYPQVVTFLQSCGYAYVARKFGKLKISGAELLLLKDSHIFEIVFGDKAESKRRDKSTQSENAKETQNGNGKENEHEHEHESESENDNNESKDEMTTYDTQSKRQDYCKNIARHVKDFAVKSHFERVYQNTWVQLDKDATDKPELLEVAKVIRMLRLGWEFGPLQFWKDDGVFFDKIDNILAFLCSNESIQDRFIRHFPGYLIDDVHASEDKSDPLTPTRLHDLASTMHESIPLKKLYVFL